ncbi:CRISPR-associated protein Csx15 [Heliophilum fasciatum]|uniref:Uncharacterized protein n=1 Tax=Heliophilum fasciatum TaxID=35700 RepID=A0A4R2RBZ7_9FIRM|nr:CRISPR-associated protein Csx15 [Heliophilum fasciatum]TCP60313.1 hypothetical protein EDD73_13912 [Heliophilum fasciatum]
MDALTVWGLFTSVIGFIATGYMGLQGWQAYQTRRDYERKLQRQTVPVMVPAEMIINVTGAPLVHFEENWHQGKQILTIPVDDIPWSRPDEASDQIVERIKAQMGEGILTGVPVVYAFPSDAGVLQYLIPKIHGLSGVFPHITTAMHCDQGAVWKKPVNLHAVRTQRRYDRQLESRS